jgi:ABC-type transporter lipoprotein component MlaA/pimeloyl-ACP methyl ester carboxylesterase
MRDSLFAACNPDSKRLHFLASSLLATIWGGFLVGCSPVASDRETHRPTSASANSIPQAEFIPDPWEPMNRGLWEVNRGLLVGVLQPTSRAYRAVVPAPARRSIMDFTRNITYPGRAANHLLQGRWSGAGDESLRFLCNTTAGIGGLFDVASQWNIPKSNADFGQTFYRWGWSPHAYVMLPGLGPSDDCHAFGLLADKAAEPWNYAYPYTYASYATSYNNLTDRAEDAARFIQSETDGYAGVKYAWSYVSKDEAPNWQSPGAKDIPTLQTLAVAMIRCQDPDFVQRGREMKVKIPSTGREMKFNAWIQPQASPVVYIAPGLGAHRLSSHTLSLAEYIYQNGFSVVTTTGIFHPEFMEHASTAALPGYPPVDCNDLLVELTEIDRALERKYSGKLGKRALVGFSMGGFQALRLATGPKHPESGLLRFDRYVAIDTPVELHRGDAVLDGCYNAPLAWPEDQRQERINQAIHKVAKLPELPQTPGAIPPFDGIESKYLVGLSFRLTLRDTIFSSQSRNHMGVLKTPLSKWRREACYEEIMNYSFRDYFLKFAVPYYQSKGVGRAAFTRELDLKSCERSLRSAADVRVVVNRNDFLLSAGDLAWLESTLGNSRLKVLPDGGHLGNLTSPPVQNAVIHALDGLK